MSGGRASPYLASSHGDTCCSLLSLTSERLSASVRNYAVNYIRCLETLFLLCRYIVLFGYLLNCRNDGMIMSGALRSF